jgi:hypothetical protein
MAHCEEGGVRREWVATVESKGLRVVTTTDGRRRRSRLYPVNACQGGSPQDELRRQRRLKLAAGWWDLSPPLEAPDEIEQRQIEEHFGEIDVDWF